MFPEFRFYKRLNLFQMEFQRCILVEHTNKSLLYHLLLHDNWKLDINYRECYIRQRKLWNNLITWRKTAMSIDSVTMFERCRCWDLWFFILIMNQTSLWGLRRVSLLMLWAQPLIGLSSWGVNAIGLERHHANIYFKNHLRSHFVPHKLKSRPFE